MTLKVRQVNGVYILELAERIDLAGGAMLKQMVKRLLDEGARSIHLNLDKVDFVNSSGLGALISILKELRHLSGGRLTLSDLNERLRSMFEITNLSKIFEIFASEQEALATYP